MGAARAVLGVVAMVVVTGCSAASSTTSASGQAPAGACRAATEAEVQSVREQLRDVKTEIAAANVVPVPVVEQLPEGFPDFILAAKFTAPGAQAATGTWSLGEANSVKTVFPLDDTAQLLAAATAIRADSALGQTFSKFSDSKAANAARACVDR